MSGGGAGAANTMVENPIPDWALDEFTTYLEKSQTYSYKDDPTLALYEYTGTIPNENDTYAKRNSDEIDGINALALRARNSSTIIISAKNLITKNLDSNNINENPYREDAYNVSKDELLQELEEEILPSIEFEALSLNMYGSSGFAIRQAKAAEKVLRHLLNKSNEVYSVDYKTERSNQDNSLIHALSYGQESTRDAELLRQSGLYDREYEQGILTSAYREYHDDQMYLIRKLEVLGNACRAIVGAQYRKVVEPYYRPSPMAQIAGIAMAGASIAASYYGARANNLAASSNTNSQVSNSIPSSLTPSSLYDAQNRFESNNSFEGVTNEW